MSVVHAPTTAMSMAPPRHLRRGSEPSSSWEETAGNSWGQSSRIQQQHAAAASSSSIASGGSTGTDRPPQIMVWCTSGSHMRTRSAVLSSLGSGTAASRSRVSMDALPAEGDNCADSHTTISPSSSSASLPIMDEEMPPPPRATAIQPAPLALASPRPVGLGLSAVRDGGRQEWPPASGLDDEPGHVTDDEHEGEVDDDDDGDDTRDQTEMDGYMASHRAPVDATLRSMPGIVGIGDGWAGGPQPKPKRRTWFRRSKKEDEAPADADPLAIWAVPETPTTPRAATSSATEETTPTASPLAQPDNKWWKSRRNLFGASRTVLNEPDTPPLSSPSKASGRPWNLRSKFNNFGSMVDLRRSPPQPEPSTAAILAGEYSRGIDVTTPTPSGPPSKRHSVSGVIRKPHPLELSHSNGSTASRSQPLVSLSASSSQPSLISPSYHHPMLRQAFARSESHLAGADSPPGTAPRPAPLIINSGAFVSPGAAMWRPQGLTPTPLLEVTEEDEEEHESPQSSDLSLKRTATFGDDEDETAPKGASVAPGLPDIAGSPIQASDPSNPSSAATPPPPTFAVENGDLAPPQSNFLHRLKSVLTLGRGKTRSSPSGSPRIPESPRSFQSEQVPSFHRPELSPNLTNSVGRGPRRRSRLFSRNRDTFDALLAFTPRPVIESSVSTPPQELSPAGTAVPSPRRSMTAPPAPMTPPTLSRGKEFPDAIGGVSDRSSILSGLGVGSSAGGLFGSPRSRRTSWAAPIPMQHDNSDEEEDDDEWSGAAAGRSRRVEKRLSRVSLRRLKGQSKQRPPLGTVFPRPPTDMQAPPSLHWAFPASYSTPMLHKFGGSTLSLALDISAEADQEQQRQQNGSMPSVVEESALSSRRESLKMEQRERALSATIAALTARQESPKTSPEMDSTSRFASTLNNGLASHSNAISRSARRTVPINIENLNSSNDSLTLPTCSVVDFPLPPSNSSGDVSSPDPDHVEQLCTPKGHQMYSKLPGYGSCYRRRTVGAAVAENEGGPIDSGDSGEESTSSTASARLRGQPSWSGDRDTVASGGITPLATPTSSTAAEDDEQHKRCGSYGSLVMDADNDVDLTPRAPAVMAKRHSTMHPTTAHVVL